MRKIPGPSKV